MTKTAGMMVISFFVSGLCMAPLALAAPAKHTKMASCNAQADDRGIREENGDERKAFMKECLSAKPVKAGGAQQNKMKSCNKEAGVKGMKGEERKKFMSTCLSS
jgi:hypothetical protein